MSLEKTASGRVLGDAGLLLLRVCASAFMMTHGYPKLMKLLAGGEIRFLDFLGLGAPVSLGLAVVGELVAPAFVLVGLFTRWAALPVVVTMAVAAFVAHAGDPFGDREMALVYLVMFTTVALTGPGRLSLDHRLRVPGHHHV